MVVGASGYKVYRGTAAGAENVYYATLATPNCGCTFSQSTMSFTDTGASYNNSASVPTTSTAVLSGNINPNPTEVNEWQTSPGSNILTLADSPANIGDVLVLTFRDNHSQ